MKTNLYILLLLSVLVFCFSFTGYSQTPDIETHQVREGNLQATFISPDIIRIQVVAGDEFASFAYPETPLKGFYPGIFRHEDRLKIKTPLYTLSHNTQPGVSQSISPWLTTKYTIENIYPLAKGMELQTSLPGGVLILDNLEKHYFPVVKNVVADRIIIISENTFTEQIELLKRLSGKSIRVKPLCRTPQIYFKPVKGKARMHIESSPGATIYFTRDGSTPTYSSEVYKKAEMLETSASIVAFATAEGRMPSEIADAQIVMSKAREIKWRYDHSDTYCGLGEYALMDGLLGDSDDYSCNWIGIPKNDMSVEIELNKPMSLSMLGIRFFQQPDKGIFVPGRIVIEVSLDGRKYHKIYRQRVKMPDAPYHHWTHAITARFRTREVKYIRIFAESDDNHKIQDTFLEGKQWIFVDEIIYEQDADKEGVRKSSNNY